MFQAGFARREITPGIGTAKVGWLKLITPTHVLDPLYVHAACFDNGSRTLGLLSLDTLSIRWTTVQAIRRAIEARTGTPGSNILLAATHNHGGPAVGAIGDVPRDEAYLADMVQRCVEAFVEAHANIRPAEMAVGRTVEFNVGFNRRIVYRDGLVRTHGQFSDAEALYTEGPIDPEVAVLACRDAATHEPLGMLVNFACHPTHHGGDLAFSAGWPGVLARVLADRGWPVSLFLNGAAGDIATTDPQRANHAADMFEVGLRVADAASRALKGIDGWTNDPPLDAAQTTVMLPHRQPGEAETTGALRGAQRFIDSAIYDRGMPGLLRRIARQPQQPAEVQRLTIGASHWVSIPAEFFACLGLRIKERAAPHRALVVGYANGMVGYVPHAEAFDRGGYETTFAASSRLDPSAGAALVDAAVSLITSAPPAYASLPGAGADPA